VPIPAKKFAEGTAADEDIEESLERPFSAGDEVIDMSKLQKSLIIIGGLLTLYALSMGPAFRSNIYYNSPTESEIRMIYAPFVWLSNCFPQVGNVIYWYLHLWI